MHASDGAGRAAQEVVGLYGDPDQVWGIAAEFALVAPVAASDVQARLGQLVGAHPHLGVADVVRRVGDADWVTARADSISRSFDHEDPLVRVLLSTDGLRLLVAAHHGAVDGLGLVAIASALVGAPITPEARGVGDRAARRGFVLSSARRVTEALVSPPARFVRRPAAATDPADDLSLLHMAPPGDIGSAALVTAGLRAFEELGARKGVPSVLVGASRRLVGTLAPDRRTAYLRLKLDRAWGQDDVAAALRDTAPEPDFPETSVKGIGPRVAHLLRGRLGATMQVSNLGVLRGEGLLSVSMFPAASGPDSVAFGLATTEHRTTLTLHTRRQDFSPEAHDRILQAVARHLGPGQWSAT